MSERAFTHVHPALAHLAGIVRQQPLLHAPPHASAGEVAYIAMANYAIKSRMYVASPGHFVLGMEVFLIVLFIVAEISERRSVKRRHLSRHGAHVEKGRLRNTTEWFSTVFRRRSRQKSQKKS